MHRRWFALVESNTSGTGQLFAETARQLGFRPILLSADPSRYKYVDKIGLEVLQLNTQDLLSLTAACRRLAGKDGLVGITSSSEYFIGSAAVLAKRLKLPGPSHHVVQACRDKHRCRQVLAAAGVGQPLFRQATSVKQALAAARDLGFPVVVKAVSGSGGVGVLLCRDGQAVADYAAAVLRQRHNERGLPVPRRVLVESFIDGPHFSVETFNNKIIGVTKNYLGSPPHFVEIGHDFPAAIPRATEHAIRGTVAKVLEALPLWGPGHIQLRLSEAPPEVRIIEVNPRLAGGFIPELARLATGVDLISETIRLAAGCGPERITMERRYASIRFLLAPCTGILRRVSGLNGAKRTGHVANVQLYRKPGERIEPRGDFRDRIGHVIACAQQRLVARAAAEEALRLLHVVTQPDRTFAATEPEMKPRRW
jgi:biotin carboxylase